MNQNKIAGTPIAESIACTNISPSNSQSITKVYQQKNPKTPQKDMCSVSSSNIMAVKEKTEKEYGWLFS